ncbi:MAG: hypothetical protein L6R37_002859 [Teloschistes peruensis]|nr:MAG: hypothetical protein L6R37_002859 [Teloschistes peruensis]
MVKRDREELIDTVPNKRLRKTLPDRLSALSDELVLVLLSYLPINDLIRCEQLSRRLRTLASDSQLWKAAYYERFVRPRAARIPGLRDTSTSDRSLLYSSKLSKWLDDGYLVKRGGATNWKRQYRLRHNWSRGSCKRTETEIAPKPSIPPILVRLHDGVAVTADAAAGLRAWSMQGSQNLVATLTWEFDDNFKATPTSLALDCSSTFTSDLRISVGFSNGSFGVYVLDRRKQSLACRYLHAPSSNGKLGQIACLSSYIATLTEAQLLSVYRFPEPGEKASDQKIVGQPQLLCSLKSYTTWPPLSLILRRSSTGITTSIAYAMPTYTSGWSVGLQELQLSPDGAVLQSRLATAISYEPAPLGGSVHRISRPSPDPSSSMVHAPLFKSSASSAKPTSLSYTHPYLLAGHSDNTLTLYMVTSNTEQLIIGPGNLLCGHTASVSGAHIGDRGKAVSVSMDGHDLRVWELEGGIASGTGRRRVPWGEASVSVRSEASCEQECRVPQKGSRGNDYMTSMEHRHTQEAVASNGWLSFDEEHVIMLGEKRQGQQALVVYNFA